MAISVAVPKNLSGIKTKVAMNLTKRQLICLGFLFISLPKISSGHRHPH